MSHNYLSAFARVSEGEGTNPTQTYHNLASFGMAQMTPNMFPTATINQTPAHSHQQSQSQQSSMGQVTQAQWNMSAGSAVQQNTQRPLTSAGLQATNLTSQMIPTTNMAGTPILEWNGREWITPQPNSLAAVAGQPGIPYSALTQIPGWNNQQQQHDNHSQNNQQQQQQTQATLLQQQVNHNQQLVHNRPAASIQPQSQAMSQKQARKKTPKTKRNTNNTANSAMKQQSRLTQPQQLSANLVPSGGLHNMSQGPSGNMNMHRTGSSDDLLAAAQLASVSGSASKEEVARESLLSLSAHQQHTDMLHQQTAAHNQIIHIQQPQATTPNHAANHTANHTANHAANHATNQASHLTQRQQGNVQVITQQQPVLTELQTVRAAPAPKPVEPETPPPPPRPVRPFDGRFAICPNCGTMSKDYNDCEYCKKMLADDCKMYDPVAAKEEVERKKQEAAKKADTERQLLIKLKQEQQKKQLEAKKAASARVSLQRVDLLSPGRGTTRGRPSKGTPQSSKSPTKSPTKSIPPPSTTKSFYGRKVAVKDYTDDDPLWTPGSGARSRGGGKPQQATYTTSKKGRKVKEAEVYIISSSDDESDEDEFPPTRPAARGRAASAPARGRKKATPPVITSPSLCSMSRPDLGRVPELFMKCKKITMGSLEGFPKEPLHIAIHGVDINIETDTEAVKIRLDNRDVREVLGCTHHKLPVLLFRANESFGRKFRDGLKMENPNTDPYYDPDSKDPRHVWIVGYLDDKAQISNFGWRLQEVFRAISLMYQTGGVLLRFIELKAARALVSSITGETSAPITALDELATSYEDDEPHDIKPQLFFEGPIRKMFTYPFPPTVGGITVTNEDYFCLNDSEFLNDIVISFYLKYLMEQVLSAADRERTFVFSTFFYTRLTQPFTGGQAKESKKTPAEKRHFRVKTWTKNVDLFSKDFIIIPINEHSHWYLAIICYPHLMGEVYADGTSSASSRPHSATSQGDTVNLRPHSAASQGDIANQKLSLSAGDNVVSSTTPEESSEAKGAAGADPVTAESTGQQVSAEDTKTHTQPTTSSSLTQSQQQSPSETTAANNVQSAAASEDLQPSSQEASSSGSVQIITPTQSLTDQSQPSSSSTDQSLLAKAAANQSESSTTGVVSLSDSKANSSVPSSSSNSVESCDKNSGLPADVFGFDSSDDDDEGQGNKGDSGTVDKKIIKRPCILIFDSLAGPGHGPVIKSLRDYLTIEWKTRKGTDRSFGREILKGANVKCPQQNNYSDCGIYLLQYVEQLFKSPPAHYAIPMKCLSNWFDYSVIKSKRSEIMSLMTEIETEFQKLPKARSGRARGTRKAVAEAQAAADALKTETTHNTTVPEALGLTPASRHTATASVTAETESAAVKEEQKDKTPAAAAVSGEAGPSEKRIKTAGEAINRVDTVSEEKGVDASNDIKEASDPVGDDGEAKAEPDTEVKVPEPVEKKEEDKKAIHEEAMEVKDDTSMDLFDSQSSTDITEIMETSTSTTAVQGSPVSMPTVDAVMSESASHKALVSSETTQLQATNGEEEMQVVVSSPMTLSSPVDTDSDMQTDMP